MTSAVRGSFIFATALIIAASFWWWFQSAADCHDRGGVLVRGVTWSGWVCAATPAETSALWLDAATPTATSWTVMSEAPGRVLPVTVRVPRSECGDAGVVCQPDPSFTDAYAVAWRCACGGAK